MAARKSPRTRVSSRGAAKRASGTRYTNPELRERIKERIQRGSKGGRPGQWSARKAQLVAAEYKKAGGGYSGGRGTKQKSLESWGKEEWQTKEGSTRARRGSTTSRYLPKKAWARLTPAQKQATERRKRAGSRAGKQFVRNTTAARTARKKATRR
ncbi:hypothetical protein HPC49_44860 [Pyxidicoccus fallax]|uniref:DUF5872 domain-containing protein n=1 Tax=Pyxidicoccus fallax TaxID=394095 RepID=A0A848LKK9_9BACT|nr:DUF5872 domain-containing protein [Pyxidicoccus fallax]NMO18258.1 hypothetical protein [Pyxidicoccus fallax]NPC85315.1 hypothetical protein [Pyxidicoccus fallax]